MSLADKVGIKSIEECQQKCRYVGTVHIGIRHDDYLVIVQLAYVKIIAVALHETTAKRIDECLDLGILKHLCNRLFLHIEYLSSKWQYRLILSVSRGFG